MIDRVLGALNRKNAVELCIDMINRVICYVNKLVDQIDVLGKLKREAPTMIIVLGNVKIEVTRAKKQDHRDMDKRVHEMNAARKAALDARRAYEDVAGSYVVGLI